MPTRFMVADDRTIINPQGIRFVEKIDATESWRAGETKFKLRVTYKGDVMLYEYADAAARDAQFDRLREALGPPRVVAAVVAPLPLTTTV